MRLKKLSRKEKTFMNTESAEQIMKNKHKNPLIISQTTRISFMTERKERIIHLITRLNRKLSN